MIKKDTAACIAYAYSEIDAAENLLAELESARKDSREPDFRDPFGRRRGLQLGVPAGDASHLLFDVAPALGIAVIRAHIEQKKSEITALCEVAALELKSSD